MTAFKLDDRFCDGYELKDSWENTTMPDQLLTFFSALFNISRSQMLNIKILDMMQTASENDCIDESFDADDDSIQSKKYIKLNCLFQIMYYQLSHGTKNTPLTTSYAQHIYGKTRSWEILTI